MNSDLKIAGNVARRSCLGGFVLLMLFLSSGCLGGAGGPELRQAAPLPEGMCRIAVLPFVNDSDYLLADMIVAKVFSSQLRQSGDFLSAQDGDTYKLYRQLYLLPGQSPNLEQMQIIADRLDVDLLITGTVLEMREDRGDHGSVNPVLILDLQIRDGRSGEVLWTTYHRRSGSDYKKTMHFGTIHTVTGLSRQMAEEIINLWFKKGLSSCSALF